MSVVDIREPRHRIELNRQKQSTERAVSRGARERGGANSLERLLHGAGS